jgi:endonuclease/exonuclease/phosphatase (EEP) superfamily protein YafD
MSWIVDLFQKGAFQTMNRENLLMMLVMTFLMGVAMSGFFTWQVTGFDGAFIQNWAGRFLTTWPVVVPVVLVAAPLARRIAQWLLSFQKSA